MFLIFVLLTIFIYLLSWANQTVVLLLRNCQHRVSDVGGHDLTVLVTANHVTPGRILEIRNVCLIGV